jgi:hypothetical protein
VLDSRNAVSDDGAGSKEVTDCIQKEGVMMFKIRKNFVYLALYGVSLYIAAIYGSHRAYLKGQLEKLSVCVALLEAAEAKQGADARPEREILEQWLDSLLITVIEFEWPHRLILRENDQYDIVVQKAREYRRRVRSETLEEILDYTGQNHLAIPP